MPLLATALYTRNAAPRTPIGTRRRGAVMVLAKGGKGGKGGGPSKSEASRMQSAEAKAHGGSVQKGSDAARAQVVGAIA